jgi:hypothetical protein
VVSAPCLQQAGGLKAKRGTMEASPRADRSNHVDLPLDVSSARLNCSLLGSRKHVRLSSRCSQYLLRMPHESLSLSKQLSSCEVCGQCRVAAWQEVPLQAATGRLLSTISGLNMLAKIDKILWTASCPSCFQSSQKGRENGRAKSCIMQLGTPDALANDLMICLYSSIQGARNRPYPS